MVHPHKSPLKLDFLIQGLANIFGWQFLKVIYEKRYVILTKSYTLHLNWEINNTFKCEAQNLETPEWVGPNVRDHYCYLLNLTYKVTYKSWLN